MYSYLQRAFIVILCLLSFSVMAQTDSTTVEGNAQPYTYIMDSLFQPLNKARIPYDILYDRVFPFAALMDSTANDTVTAERFIQAYSELIINNSF